jgi:hypothetical protein
LVVKDRDLLKTRMKITAYNQHHVGSFSRALVCFVTTNLLVVIEPTSLCNQTKPRGIARRSEELAPAAAVLNKTARQQRLYSCPTPF